MPDRLYQQNHCGIYRMERPEGRWVRIGDNMPRKIFINQKQARDLTAPLRSSDEIQIISALSGG